MHIRVARGVEMEEGICYKAHRKIWQGVRGDGGGSGTFLDLNCIDGRTTCQNLQNCILERLSITV